MKIAELTLMQEYLLVPCVETLLGWMIQKKLESQSTALQE
jgi:hypothetical protein